LTNQFGESGWIISKHLHGWLKCLYGFRACLEARGVTSLSAANLEIAEVTGYKKENEIASLSKTNQKAKNIWAITRILCERKGASPRLQVQPAVPG
jgi:hypothetical protein